MGEGSNNWVVAGARSESGAPLLANDPHLGLEAPSVWYLAHLAAPGLDVLGATIPGIPAVVVGRNRHAAWGVTSTGADVQDLVAVTDADVTARRVETIVVRGGDAERLEVVETAFGPVVSGFRRFAGAGRAALSWTALADDDATLAAGLRLARAGSIADAFAALEDFHGPAQNFVLADRRGGIGFTVAGSIPVRRGHDGWLPVAAAKGGWIGRLPYAELPRLRDPPGGAIVTANQDISPPGWPHFIARDWAEDYRARRIASVLAAREKHTVAGFMALQTDTVSLMAREFLPLMLPAVADSPWAARLAAWDGAMDPDLAEPLVFQAWFRAFAHALFDRNLAPFRDRYGGRRPATVRRVLAADPSWCGGPPPGDCGARARAGAGGRPRPGRRGVRRRPRRLALGGGAQGGRPALAHRPPSPAPPPVRGGKGAWRRPLHRYAGEHADRRCARALRRNPRREPARGLRPGRPRRRAPHRLSRPVRAPAVAALRRPRGPVGAGRLSHPADDA